MRQRDAAIAAEQDAARQREAAVAAERQAEAHFRQARRAVDQYLATIRDSALLADTGTRPLRDQLLESARPFYQSIVEKATSDAQPSADVASAQLRRGQILEDLGDRDTAREAYRAARALLDEIALRTPTPEVQLERAEACLALGEPTQAMALAQALLDADPSLAEARRLLHRAQVATAQSQASAGDRDAALASFRAAQALLEPLTSIEAPSAVDLAALATVQLELGDFHRRQPDVPAALVATRGAIEAAERAREREPQTARYGELVAIGSLRSPAARGCRADRRGGQCVPARDHHLVEAGVRTSDDATTQSGHPAHLAGTHGAATVVTATGRCGRYAASSRPVPR